MLYVRQHAASDIYRDAISGRLNVFAPGFRAGRARSGASEGMWRERAVQRPGALAPGRICEHTAGGGGEHWGADPETGMAEQVAVSRGSMLKAFKSLSFENVADDIIDKCQQMCETHNLSPIDLAYKWEAHIDKVTRDACFVQCPLPSCVVEETRMSTCLHCVGRCSLVWTE